MEFNGLLLSFLLSLKLVKGTDEQRCVKHTPMTTHTSKEPNLTNLCIISDVTEWLAQYLLFLIKTKAKKKYTKLNLFTISRLKIFSTWFSLKSYPDSIPFHTIVQGNFLQYYRTYNFSDGLDDFIP